MTAAEPKPPAPALETGLSPNLYKTEQNFYSRRPIVREWTGNASAR
jgi:hypothetical protein